MAINNLVPEDATERRQFDNHTKLFGGNTLLQIAGALRIQSDFMPPQGSLAKVTIIQSNELVKAANELAEKDKLIAEMNDTLIDNQRVIRLAEEVLDKQSATITKQSSIIDRYGAAFSEASRAIELAVEVNEGLLGVNEANIKLLLKQFSTSQECNTETPS